MGTSDAARLLLHYAFLYLCCTSTTERTNEQEDLGWSMNCYSCKNKFCWCDHVLSCQNNDIQDVWYHSKYTHNISNIAITPVEVCHRRVSVSDTQYYSHLFYSSFLYHNFGRSLGHHRWICNNPFPPCPATLDELAKVGRKTLKNWFN